MRTTIYILKFQALILLICLPLIAFPDSIPTPAEDIENISVIADAVAQTIVPFLPTPVTKLAVIILIGIASRIIEKRMIKKRHKEELEAIKRGLEK